MKVISASNAGLSNGRTTVFEAVGEGSIPSPAANLNDLNSVGRNLSGL